MGFEQLVRNGNLPSKGWGVKINIFQLPPPSWLCFFSIAFSFLFFFPWVFPLLLFFKLDLFVVLELLFLCFLVLLVLTLFVDNVSCLQNSFFMPFLSCFFHVQYFLYTFFCYVFFLDVCSSTVLPNPTKLKDIKKGNLSCFVASGRCKNKSSSYTTQ